WGEVYPRIRTAAAQCGFDESNTRHAVSSRGQIEIPCERFDARGLAASRGRHSRMRLEHVGQVCVKVRECVVEALGVTRRQSRRSRCGRCEVGPGAGVDALAAAGMIQHEPFVASVRPLERSLLSGYAKKHVVLHATGNLRAYEQSPSAVLVLQQHRRIIV